MKQELGADEKEISFLERQFVEYLEGLSHEENENILGRLNQRHIKKSFYVKKIWLYPTDWPNKLYENNVMACRRHYLIRLIHSVNEKNSEVIFQQGKTRVYCQE